MTAEKAADLILGNTPLPPQPIPFYQRERAGGQGAETPVRSDK
jgi:choline dehydrogenase